MKFMRQGYMIVNTKTDEALPYSQLGSTAYDCWKKTAVAGEWCTENKDGDVDPDDYRAYRAEMKSWRARRVFIYMD